MDSSAYKRRASDEAYDTLQRLIIEGELRPGDRLKEVELAERLGMSRTPVREAIRRLERDGAVTVLPNRGVSVRELDEREIEDTYSLRAVLEGFCASRAAQRIDALELAQLGEIQAEFERRIRPDGTVEDEDIEALIRLNTAFHATILIGSKNTRLEDVLRRASEVPVTMKQAYWRSPAARAAMLVHHREILEAIRARDPVRAEAVMRTHLYAIKDFFTRQQRTAGIQALLEDGSTTKPDVVQVDPSRQRREAPDVE